MKEKERFIKGKGMATYDEKGHRTITMRIMRPITDPEWNRQQMNTRVRMSKKERLRQRRKMEQAVNAETAREGSF